jgi:uncharacterized membrane protein YphA (DoxX/SURF4 family)
VVDLSTIARIVVGLLLLWAAAAKLRRRQDLPDWLAAYGVPANAAPSVAWGVIAAEGLVGILVLFGIATPASIYAAIALGLVFVGALGLARLRGVERLRCGCFGASEGKTTHLLLRAVGFTLVAILAASGAEIDVGGSSDTLIAVALVVLTAAVILLSLLVLALYRQVGVLTMRIGPRVPFELAEEGPEVGASAPPLEGLRGRRAEVVFFFSATCRLCRQLSPGVAALARQGLAVRVVEEEQEEDVFKRWNVPGTPFVVHVVDGVVAAKGTVNTLEELETLLDAGKARMNAAA